MKLPIELRESLVLAIDDYFEMENDDPSADLLAEQLISILEHAAEDADVEEVDDLPTRIEVEAEMEEPLQEMLELEFAKNDEMELTGEDVVGVLERLAGIEWEEADSMLDDLEDMEEGVGLNEPEYDDE